MDEKNNVNKTLRFAVFADLHYKKNMYAASVSDLDKILSRANGAQVGFVIHAGDFSNDYIGSPELTRAYLDNGYDLPVYGVFGNHELESRGNSMEVVTKLLSNQSESVIWGTPDGKLGDSGIGYYYFDENGFRVICLDTNYSLLDGSWVHNTENSYGPPKGSVKENSLGPVQLGWLEKVLFDAADLGLSCIIVSHAEFSGTNSSPSSDALAVRELFARVNSKRRKTVVLAINGHYHTDRTALVDDVLYFDCNTVQNGYWKICDSQHYTDAQTFTFEDYDADGRLINIYEKQLCSLSQAKNTWFFTEPLSAIITVSRDEIVIEGSVSEWRYGVEPDSNSAAIHPMITSSEICLETDE